MWNRGSSLLLCLFFGGSNHIMDLIITLEIVKVWQTVVDKDDPYVQGCVR